MKKRLILSLIGIIFSLFFINLISAGACRNDRGEYYYCEKARYDYYLNNFHDYMRYYYVDYEINYSYCDDYHYYKDVYDYDVYRHYCLNDGIYRAYLDKYGNLVKEVRYNYRKRYYCDYGYRGFRNCRYVYDYQDDSLYPDYYRYQAEKENQKTEKLMPPVIYIG